MAKRKSFYVGKIVHMRLFGDEGYMVGRVIRAFIDLDVFYLVFVPEGALYGENIATSSINRIRVVGVVPERDAPKLPASRPRRANKTPRRRAK